MSVRFKQLGTFRSIMLKHSFFFWNKWNLLWTTIQQNVETPQKVNFSAFLCCCWLSIYCIKWSFLRFKIDLSFHNNVKYSVYYHHSQTIFKWFNCIFFIRFQQFLWVQPNFVRKPGFQITEFIVLSQLLDLCLVLLICFSSGSAGEECLHTEKKQTRKVCK